MDVRDLWVHSSYILDILCVKWSNQTNLSSVFFQDVQVNGDNVEGTNVEDSPALPTVTDPKKAKAEQKRLEKEAIEREKKRKQDEKRQLKEQEKQTKENARKEKSAATTRKQERDDKKQKGGIASFMSPARKTGRPKNTVHGRVMLLDGAEIEVEIEVSIYHLLIISI